MKAQKWYTIEDSIYKAFDILTTEKNINKSLFIEDYIKKFLKDNDMDYVDKLYSLKENPNHVVSVISQDSTYYFLDDGSKIQKILFMQIFKECEAVNPNDFFKKSEPILEKIVEKIKNIDETKISETTENNKSSLDSVMNIMNIMNNEYNSSIQNKNEQISLLNEINNIYKTKTYLSMSRLEICEIIIKLMYINFDVDSHEYKLQQLLISLFSDLKDLVLF